MSQMVKESVPRIEPNIATPVQEGICAFPYKRSKTLDAQHAIAILEAHHLFPELVGCVPDISHVLAAALTGFSSLVMLGYLSVDALLHIPVPLYGLVPFFLAH